MLPYIPYMDPMGYINKLDLRTVNVNPVLMILKVRRHSRNGCVNLRGLLWFDLIASKNTPKNIKTSQDAHENDWTWIYTIP
jgi:hypothetical protein